MDYIPYDYYINSINCTPTVTPAAVTPTVPELLHSPYISPQPPLILHLSFSLLLHGPFVSPQTSQIQFSPFCRGGINWLVCRSNSLGILHFTY